MRSDLARLEVGRRKPRLLQRLRGHRQSVRVLGPPPKKTNGTSTKRRGRGVVFLKGPFLGWLLFFPAKPKGTHHPCWGVPIPMLRHTQRELLDPFKGAFCFPLAKCGHIRGTLPNTEIPPLRQPPLLPCGVFVFFSFFSRRAVSSTNNQGPYV